MHSLWLLAFLLTLLLAVYQRLSGPTYPIRGSETIAGITIQYKFFRSWTSGHAHCRCASLLQTRDSNCGSISAATLSSATKNGIYRP